jgi:hypothetical protein
MQKNPVSRLNFQTHRKNPTGDRERRKEKLVGIVVVVVGVL